MSDTGSSSCVDNKSAFPEMFLLAQVSPEAVRSRGLYRELWSERAWGGESFLSNQIESDDTRRPQTKSAEWWENKTRLSDLDEGRVLFVVCSKDSERCELLQVVMTDTPAIKVLKCRATDAAAIATG